MLTRTALACLLVPALVAGCADETVDDEDSTTGAIVGDQLANDERPEVVHLSISTSKATYACTGTIVGRRTILTARHCLEGDVIRADGTCTGVASVDLFGRGKSGGVQYTFERCATPRLGSVAYWTNDFGFIRLSKPVVGVTPAKLAGEKPRTDRFTTYGYGMHGEAKLGGCEAEPDGNKRKLAYRGRIGAHFGVQTCPGDSGGPHFIGTSNVIAGVTSGGRLYVESTAVAFAYADELAAQIAAFER